VDHAEQVRLVKTALAAIERGATPLTERWTENDPIAYVSAERAERENKVLFCGTLPIVAGLSSQVSQPGDFLVDDLSLVPTLVVRDDSGELNAFANICRHRGSRIASGCGRGASRFVCPYHGWSYDTKGRLRAIPEEAGFAGMERDAHGLIPLPVEEKYGLVWVTPGGRARLGVDELLGGLAADLRSYAIERQELCQTRVVRRRMNWKLMSDTFWEAYHIKVLHRDNIAPLFVRNLALFDAFGPSHRLVGVRRSIETLRRRPEADWDLVPHATILMNIFPNTILVMQTDHLELYRIFPVGDGRGQSLVEVSLVSPSVRAAGPRRTWEETMDLLLGVVDQDFTIGEGIQRNFETGLLPSVVYGRFEPALEHFHRSIREALEEAG
jgi:phenylpropionate dioxygenase-like ring-hydroxylating dioxygenase large terminal subunit